MSTPSLVPTLPGRRYADPAVLAGFHDWVREWFPAPRRLSLNDKCGTLNSLWVVIMTTIRIN